MLVPTARGRMLSAFLEQYFGKWVDFDFTSTMENELDLVSAGSQERLPLLQRFWHELQEDSAALDEVSAAQVRRPPRGASLTVWVPFERRAVLPSVCVCSERSSSVQVLEAVDKRMEAIAFPDPGTGADVRQCPLCSTGRLSIHISRKFGPFVACSNRREGAAEPCTFRRGLRSALSSETEAAGGRVVGINPETRAEMRVVEGPHGWCAISCPRCRSRLVLFDRCFLQRCDRLDDSVPGASCSLGVQVPARDR